MKVFSRPVILAALLIPILLASGAASQAADRYLERLPDAPPAESDAALVPDTALKTKLLSAQVWVQCQVTPSDGTMRKCTMQTAAPSDAGLGDAALAVASRLAATEPVRERWGGGSKVTIRVQFTRENAKLAFKVAYSFNHITPLLSATRGPVPVNLDDAVTTPIWTARPTPEEIDAAWPAKAKAVGQTGTARLECRVKGDQLTGCKTFSVFPGGQGFGEAALTLADRFRVDPALSAGVPDEVAFGAPDPMPDVRPAEGRRVRVAIQFGKLEAGSPPTPPAFTADEPVTDIVWDTGPTGDLMARFYPERALRLGLAGRANVSCRLDAEGRLTDCSVEAIPDDAGFSLAALRTVRYFQANPVSKSGRPVAGRAVNIPVYFNIPE